MFRVRLRPALSEDVELREIVLKHIRRHLRLRIGLADSHGSDMLVEDRPELFDRLRIDLEHLLGKLDTRYLVRPIRLAEKIELRRDESPVSFEGALPMMVPAELGAYRVLLYSGNFGVAHDVDTFLEAYENHHRGGTGRVALWLNATGAKADRLETELRKRLLPIHRSPPVPLDQLPELLVTPAAHLITLRDEFVGYVLPSKVYGCIASGKPVLFVGSVESDVDRLCRERIPRSYRRAAVGDVAAVERALDEIGRGALP